MNNTEKYIDYTNQKNRRNVSIQISGSKSESNRLLILKQCYPNLTINNISDSDDSVHLTAALKGDKKLVDIGHAGTAMRFLTAYFALTSGTDVILTGSERMQNRPIGILVDALRSIGADIQFVEKEGYPPLEIKGKTPTKNSLRIAGNVSSQYITALLLKAPTLENGLTIDLQSEITSRPYLEMTRSLLKSLGVETEFNDQQIKILPKSQIEDKEITVESDWSSASYFYSLVALSPVGTRIKLQSYREKSLQGDSCLSAIYLAFGVSTEFNNDEILLSKTNNEYPDIISLDLRDAPDIAQTIVVTCIGLEIGCELTGLHTLKIKETDRLVAMKIESEKLGAKIDITEDSLQLYPTASLKLNCQIATYNDHRMAMAFAPLAIKVPMIIEDADVVTKSYQRFWDDMNSCFE